LGQSDSPPENIELRLVVPATTPALPRTGTVALMTAVLEEAIRSCLSRTPRVRAEAEAWLKSGQRHSIFSFLTICEILGLEPLATREAILHLISGRAGRRTRRARSNVRGALVSAESMKARRPGPRR
jgi:hypothetical protein